MFRDAHTEGRMHRRTGQNHYASDHIRLGGGNEALKVKVVNIVLKLIDAYTCKNETSAEAYLPSK